MARFRVVLVEHGYGDISHEREIIEAADGELIDAETISPLQLRPLLAEADGLLVRRGIVDAAFLRNLPKCKVIVRYGVGVDNIDLQAASEAGILVGHVPFYCQGEVSSHAIGLLLALTRRIVSTHQLMKNGGWDIHRNVPVSRMTGKTLGLAGFGTLGQAVAQKLQGWGMHIIATDPFIEPERADRLNVQLVSFEELLGRSDYISLHTPLLPETFHLMNSRAFEKVKPGAFLVNTARGPLVEGPALLEALEKEIIAGAGIDVFVQEPLPEDSPLRNHPGIIITDHMAWYSVESQLQLQKTAAEEVVRGCTGALPRAIANPEVLGKLGKIAEWEPTWMATWQQKRLEKLGIARL
ncbi:MAG: C-terminal binding protein [Verrucomicrobiales bacterium]